MNQNLPNKQSPKGTGFEWFLFYFILALSVKENDHAKKSVLLALL